MRMKAFLGSLSSLGTALALTTGIALAAGEYEVKAAKGEVTVVPKGAFHVNLEYPWKVTAGGKTFDKSKFALTKESAKITGLPAGPAHLKGAVCEGTDKCVPFEADVTVN